MPNYVTQYFTFGTFINLHYLHGCRVLQEIMNADLTHVSTGFPPVDPRTSKSSVKRMVCKTLLDHTRSRRNGASSISRVRLLGCLYQEDDHNLEAPAMVEEILWNPIRFFFIKHIFPRYLQRRLLGDLASHKGSARGHGSIFGCCFGCCIWLLWVRCLVPRTILSENT